MSDIHEQIAQLEQQVASTKARREKAEADAREARIVAATVEALTAAGVPPENHRVAVAMVHNADCRIIIDEQDQVSMGQLPRRDLGWPDRPLRGHPRLA